MIIKKSDHSFNLILGFSLNETFWDFLAFNVILFSFNLILGFSLNETDGGFGMSLEELDSFNLILGFSLNETILQEKRGTLKIEVST